MKKSLYKIIIATLFIAASLGVDHIPGTNSYFTSKTGVKGNSMTAGWWVTPTVKVTEPAKGDKLTAGGPLSDIIWQATSSDPGATKDMDIDIVYQCDGTSWIKIPNSGDNTGLFLWTVPDKTYDNCVIKVTAKDSHGLSNFGLSGKFDIVSPFSSGDVVINEVMWMGTLKNDDDQWLELKNTTDHDIDITNWTLDGAAANGGQLKLTGNAGKIYYLEKKVFSSSLILLPTRQK